MLRIIITYFILLYPVISTPAMAQASTSPDRCTVFECTCEVKHIKREMFSTMNYSETHGASIYFAEDSSSLDENAEAKVSEFLKFVGKKDNIVITGYADGCGDFYYNKKLSTDRAERVRRQLRLVGISSSIEIRVKGELSSSHDPRSRRVDIDVNKRSTLTKKIEGIEADAYLLDASGSTSGDFEIWTDIIGASFPPKSKIYVSKMHGCRNGQYLNSIKPSGGTEIWFSYWSVIDKMNRGERLLIVSDFDSNVPLTDFEYRKIEEKIREKGIKVYTIRL